MTKNLLINTFVIVVALLAGTFLQQYLNKPENTPQTVETRWLHEEWKGQVVMLNFWATWCPPCKEEIPDFVKLQTDLAEKGFQVVGAALDTPDLVAEFTAKVPLNYPNFILEAGEGSLIMEKYGNTLGTLPYTVFIDRDGKIVETHYKGVLHYKDALKIIEPLL